jgi:hypothetical protein
MPNKNKHDNVEEEESNTTLSKAFKLIKDIDNRDLRYYIHKLENFKPPDPVLLSKVYNAKKTHLKKITLSNKEQEIINKYGKAASLYLNYIIMVDTNEEKY